MPKDPNFELTFKRGKLRSKPGYSVRSIPNADISTHKRNLTTLNLDRKVLEKAKTLFPGQISMLVNLFLREVVKKRPRIIFDMPFERPPEAEQNPFNRPALIVQLKKRTREFVAEYDTFFNAGQATGINPNSIMNVCNKTKNGKTAGGFIWEYKDQVE